MNRLRQSADLPPLAASSASSAAPTPRGLVTQHRQHEVVAGAVLGVAARRLVGPTGRIEEEVRFPDEPATDHEPFRIEQLDQVREAERDPAGVGLLTSRASRSPVRAAAVTRSPAMCSAPPARSTIACPPVPVSIASPVQRGPSPTRTAPSSRAVRTGRVRRRARRPCGRPRPRTSAPRSSLPSLITPPPTPVPNETTIACLVPVPRPRRIPRRREFASLSKASVGPVGPRWCPVTSSITLRRRPRGGRAALLRQVRRRVEDVAAVDEPGQGDADRVDRTGVVPGMLERPGDCGAERGQQRRGESWRTRPRRAACRWRA